MTNIYYRTQIKFTYGLSVGIALLTLLLTGCEDKVNLTKLCDKNTEICSEFEDDSWCRKNRTDILINKINIKKNNLEIDKYHLLLAYEGYIKCMSIASQIQHIKSKKITIRRKSDLLKAEIDLSLLSEEVINAKHPHLLYYQWSRESNELALAEFLQLEGSPILENSTAQYHLATYYIKHNSKKTLGLLYRSLELHEPGTELPPEILQTFSTIFIKKKQYKQAYIWLRTYQLLLDEPDKMIEESLNYYQKHKKLDASFLDKVASATLSKIQAGEFTTPSY